MSYFWKSFVAFVFEILCFQKVFHSRKGFLKLVCMQYSNCTSACLFLLSNDILLLIIIEISTVKKNTIEKKKTRRRKRRKTEQPTTIIIQAAEPMTSTSPTTKKAISPTLARMKSASPALPLDYSFMGMKSLSGEWLFVVIVVCLFVCLFVKHEPAIC